MQQSVTKIGVGQMIRLVLNKKGRTVVWLAERLGCSRTNVYKIFERHSIGTEYLLEISKILEYDFFKLYSEELEKENWE